VTAPAAAASLVCTGLCVACLVYLHLAPTGYSPVRNAVSEYGVGAYARWYQAQVTCAGLAAIGLAVALGGPRRVLVLLTVFAVTRLAIAHAPLDTRPIVHWVLAVVAFGAVTIAATNLKPAQHGSPTLGWAMVACAILMGITRRSTQPRRWFGLAERGFYAAMLAWLALVAVRLV
jgi:hypothetical protein